MGAWIETDGLLNTMAVPVSRPAWARGLKHAIIDNEEARYVAPRVGAWIETKHHPLKGDAHPSRPAWARGLKLKDLDKLSEGDTSRPAWARGLKPPAW